MIGAAGRRVMAGRERQFAVAMQLVLVAIVVYGLVERQPKAITNGTLALVISFLPALFERDGRVTLDPWLSLWITAAVFFHTLGSAGLYAQIDWWDHLTHAFSATLVAGIGYTTVRTIQLHSDGVHLPDRFAFVYILLFVIAFGVVWELFEYGLDVVADLTGLTMPLSQLGLEDTVVDLMFNTLGALVVATFGQVHLNDVAEQLRGVLFDPSG